MSDNVSCPFCGEIFPPFASCSLAEHPKSFSSECPVQGQQFTIKMWNMRPPKKEVGHTPKVTQDEVEWLRAMVERLTVAPAPLHADCMEYASKKFAERMK